MTMTNAALQARVNDFNWLLSSFAENTTGVEQAICVSADGLLMAMSSNLDRAAADKLAAIVSGLRSLSDGASRVMGRGGVNQVIVEMKEGYLFASSIGHGSSLGVLTEPHRRPRPGRLRHDAVRAAGRRPAQPRAHHRAEEQPGSMTPDAVQPNREPTRPSFARPFLDPGVRPAGHLDRGVGCERSDGPGVHHHRWPHQRATRRNCASSPWWH